MGEVVRAFDGPVSLNRHIGLTAIESIALECLKQIAREGRQATQPELCAATGAMYQSGTVPAILKRLEQKGYITRKVYQRGFAVSISGTNLSTAEPPNTAPHWRDRTDQVQSPAIHMVRQKMPQASVLIEQEARKLGKPMSDFLADLVYIGWHEYQREGEQAE